MCAAHRGWKYRFAVSERLGERAQSFTQPKNHVHQNHGRQRLVAQGLRNREIADRLCISEGTVKVHLSNIYEKLKVDGRVALLRYAQEKGMV